MLIALLVFNGAATGVCLLSVGAYRVALLTSDNFDSHEMVPRKQCVLTVIFVALLFFNLMNGIGLLMLNLDRAAAFVIPIFYFHNHNRIMLLLMFICVALSGALITAAVIVTLTASEQYVTRTCRQFDTINFPFYVAIIAVRSISGTLAVCVMLTIVVVMFMRRAKVFNTQAHGADQLHSFRERQRKLTYTTIISCIITLFLFVIPSLIQLCLCFGNVDLLRVVSPYTMSLTFLNCTNEALVFMIRQEAIRRSVCDFITQQTPTFLRERILSIVSAYSSSEPRMMIFHTFSQKKTSSTGIKH
ncbi:unnamed protein product [Anisakis simplex]|uniref:G_PROTEIN_RECEP_F1_2 domain-containing protein n=1 Tax=Anisakis simplex TaxID=6269 RepID=A0A0M3KA68_ANISI|nr:unnamed protein product [Anisakis simplex]